MTRLEARRARYIRDLTGDIPLYMIVVGAALDEEALAYDVIPRMPGEDDDAFRGRISNAASLENLVTSMLGSLWERPVAPALQGRKRDRM